MSKEIKDECDFLYKIIEYANLKLTEIRNNCKHENTFEGLYSWRVGCIDPATICSDCGELIKNHAWQIDKSKL